MQFDRKMIGVCLLGIVLGWWLASSSSSPVAPDRPADRPVLRAIARVAKMFLWVALAAEKPPASDTKTYVVHARVDENGNPILDHARGW